MKLLIFAAILSKFIYGQTNNSEICGAITFSDDSDNIYAKIDEHPWVVGIGFFYPEHQKTYIDCAGALVSKRFVIAGGPCVINDYESSLSIVRFGEWNISSTVDCEDGICADKTVDIAVGEVFTRYDSNTEFVNNIALIKLAKDVQYTKWIQPICLPDVKSLRRIKTYVGATFVVSGWSKTPEVKKSDIKLKRRVVVAEDDKCKSYPNYKSLFDPYLHFCSTTSAACDGDGPVMGIDTSDPDRPFWYLFGLFLRSNECFHSPQVFTKIVPLLGWIENVMDNN